MKPNVSLSHPEKYTYLRILLIFFIKIIHFKMKLHLLGNMKEEIRSVWGHGYMSSLFNMFILSFHRSFLWVVIKGNVIRFSFLSNVLLTLKAVAQTADEWHLPAEEELHFCPFCYVTWIPGLFHFGTATCSCSEVARWPEVIPVGAQVKREKEFSATHSSISPWIYLSGAA